MPRKNLDIKNCASKLKQCWRSIIIVLFAIVWKQHFRLDRLKIEPEIKLIVAARNDWRYFRTTLRLTTTGLIFFAC